jgi:hypothetical protein
MYSNPGRSSGIAGNSMFSYSLINRMFALLIHNENLKRKTILKTAKKHLTYLRHPIIYLHLLKPKS